MVAIQASDCVGSGEGTSAPTSESGTPSKTRKQMDISSVGAISRSRPNALTVGNRSARLPVKSVQLILKSTINRRFEVKQMILTKEKIANILSEKSEYLFEIL